MITETMLNDLHDEKLAVHSRENEKETMCDSCDSEPDTCGKTLADCMEIAEGDAVDAAYEAWRGEQ